MASGQGEELLRAKIIEAQSELNPNQIIDVAVFVGLITTIFEAIRGCRNKVAAERSISRGGAVAQSKISKALKADNYKGDADEMAAKLCAKGRKLTEEEVKVIIEDAEELPQPPPVAGGFWPMWVMLLLVFPTFGYAQEKGFWPVDEQQNKRIDDHDIHVQAIHHLLENINKRVEHLENKTNISIPSVEPTLVLPQKQSLGPVKPSKVLVAIPVQKTAVCQCKGSNRGVCYCLKAGMQCKCTASVGSVWNLDGAKGVSKTGEYKNPSTMQVIAKPALGAPVSMMEKVIAKEIHAGVVRATNTQVRVVAVIPVQPVIQYQQRCIRGRCYWFQVR